VNTNISELDKAYIAGFVDGEGNISIYKDARGSCLHYVISIHNTNVEILEWIRHTLGVGKIYSKDSKRDNWKIGYQLTTQRMSDMKDILEQLKPYFRLKAPHADIALSLISIRLMRRNGKKFVPLNDIEEVLVGVMKRLNHKGGNIWEEKLSYNVEQTLG